MSAATRAMLAIAAVLSLTSVPCPAAWVRVFEDEFSSNTWAYAGVSNGLGQALFRHDAGQQRIDAQWDQGNYYNGAPDPQVMVNSRLSRPIGRTLTDRDTFRFGATLRMAAGSIPDTFEFYQIASFGLYNLDPETRGEDRIQSDNFSGNTTLVRDCNDLVEFNYFINNESFGFNPFVQGVAVARVPAGEADATGYFITGTGSDPFFHDTDMGADTYLPSDTNLYIEVVYYGRATNSLARRTFMGIYTDAAKTNLLTVNGVSMFYWTQPAPLNRTFDVSDFGFVNCAGVNFTVMFGGSTPNGAGTGTYDDVYVDLYRELGETHQASADPASGFTLTWVSEPGTNYYIVSSTNLVAGSWSTDAIVQASGSLTTWTGPVSTVGRTYGIRY
jgi:hypothetical protein